MEQSDTFNTYEERIIDLWQVAEVELTYRNKLLAKDRPHVNTSQAAFQVLSNVWDRNKIELVEDFKILLLNRHGRCLGVSHIATGGTSSCIADPKIVFATALKANAASIILAHNHPSGNLKPSDADKEMTNNLVEGGKYLQIHVRDHLIISATGYCSMSDEGLMLS